MKWTVIFVMACAIMLQTVDMKQCKGWCWWCRHCKKRDSSDTSNVFRKLHLEKRADHCKFAALDLNGNGFVTWEEIDTTLKKNGHIDESSKTVFNIIDKNDDQRVTENEYVTSFSDLEELGAIMCG